MSVNQQQVTLLTAELATLNTMRSTLVTAGASTTAVDTQIANCTNTLGAFNALLTAEQTLAQNNIDASTVKQNLISNLGSAYTTLIHNSIICPSGNCVNCIGCKYTYYMTNGLTAQQFAMLL